jgi:hypothetical protein
MQTATAQTPAARREIPSLNPKTSAVIIRALLKAAFPATKFSVVTERGSMVSSVRISYTDGPTVKRVEAIVNVFEAGHFDGMTDSYEYDRDAYIVHEGVTYRPGTRYVFVEREISPSFARRCLATLANYFKPESVPVVFDGTDYRGLPCWKLAEDRALPMVGERWSTMIYRAASDAAAFTFAGRGV